MTPCRLCCAIMICVCFLMGGLLMMGGMFMTFNGYSSLSDEDSKTNRTFRITGPLTLVLGGVSFISCIVLCVFARKLYVDEQNKNATTSGGVSGPFIHGMAPPKPQVHPSAPSELKPCFPPDNMSINPTDPMIADVEAPPSYDSIKEKM